MNGYLTKKYCCKCKKWQDKALMYCVECDIMLRNKPRAKKYKEKLFVL